VTVQERRALVGEATGADPTRSAVRSRQGGLDAETADKFVENVLGTYALPYGVALNVRVNGQDHVVPMVVEEPSVVAAASNAAKMVRAGGGFIAEVGSRAHDRQISSRRPRRRGGGRPIATTPRRSSRSPTGDRRARCARRRGSARIEARVGWPRT
jgi:hydroxymethylglutaryl-CoA reductase